jgi:catechol 2,3-dioxygenase-like lactoylglutathione lyase family enzyme
MSVKRIVPDIKSKDLDASRQFYVDVLGLVVAMDMGFIVTLVSPSNPTAQVSLMRDNDSSMILPQMSIEVADVDAVHSRAVSHRLNIVYPLTNDLALATTQDRGHHARVATAVQHGDDPQRAFVRCIGYQVVANELET